jgi:hypothetical protein
MLIVSIVFLYYTGKFTFTVGLYLSFFSIFFNFNLQQRTVFLIVRIFSLWGDKANIFFSFCSYVHSVSDISSHGLANELITLYFDSWNNKFMELGILAMRCFTFPTRWLTMRISNLV